MSDKIFDKDITLHHDRQAEPQACDPVDGPREEW